MKALRGIRARFHVHDPALFWFPAQTSVINQVVFKSKARELIPEIQEQYLQESFEGLANEHLSDTVNDNDMKNLFRRVYKQFLRDDELKEYFSDSAILHQIRVHINRNLTMRKDGLKFIRNLKKNDIQYGLLKSDHLRSLGYMDNHYSRLLSSISKKSGVPIDGVKCSRILPSDDSFVNEGIMMDYLQQFEHKKGINDYLVVNSPQAAEALTSMGFKLGLKLILVTDPYFKFPTSTLEPIYTQYNEAKKTQNDGLSQDICDELLSMNQITVKSLDEIQNLIEMIKNNEISNSIVNLNNFWGTLEQMELSILGNLESRHGPLAQKTY